MVFRRLISAYVHKAWISALVPTAILSVWLGISIWIAGSSGSLTKTLVWFIDILSILWVISTVALLIMAVYFMKQKKWWSALGRAVLCAGSVLLGLVLLLVSTFIISDQPDHFADNLTIPPGLKLSIPLASHMMMTKQPPTPMHDGFHHALMVAGKTKKPFQRTIHTDIPALFTLQRDHRDLLHRYLACSPAWRVFEEDGHRYAMRRWFSTPHWHSESNGYYSAGASTIKTVIGLDGKNIFRRVQSLPFGEDCEPVIGHFPKGVNRSMESTTAFKQNGLLVSLYENSGRPERRMTAAAIDYMNTEFQSLLNNPRPKAIWQLVAPLQSPPSKPSITLWNDIQPGLYEADIWANPGEPGCVYLKAFEVTGNTSLSEGRLWEDTNEWIGWSNEPRQLFQANSSFTIYEGDWGHPYAARFEVWFKPDSGQPDRKLIERVFKIEGWQR